MTLLEYIDRSRPEFKAGCLPYVGEYARRLPSHPGSQKDQNGLALHTVQVIEKALELNQEFEPRDIIETGLAHDLTNWQELPLLDFQVLAIQATRGLPWKVWRKTPHYRFVALILVADMWSAYLNLGDK